MDGGEGLIYPRASRRYPVRYEGTEYLDKHLGSPTAPPFGIVLEMMYGGDWRRRCSLVFGRSYKVILHIAAGRDGIPRKMLQHIRDKALDPGETANFERLERERFEKYLQRRLAYRKCAGRWCGLVLDGLAMFPGSRLCLVRKPFRRRRKPL